MPISSAAESTQPPSTESVETTPEIMRRRADSPKVSPSLRIAETFISRQGEGQRTGSNSFFIRTSGCNLRCWFCDTPYASWAPEGGHHTIDRLVEAAVASGCPDVVLTGGEPLLPAGVVELVDRLRAQALHVTIETAGTRFRDLTADLMSISPKLAGSGPRALPVVDGGAQTGVFATSADWSRRHEATRWRPDVIRRLIDRSVDFQLKFVVDEPADFVATVDAVEQLGVAADHVWIMPQGTDAATLDARAAWLRPRCASHGYHYCDRLHIRWYGNQRGT